MTTMTCVVVNQSPFPLQMANPAFYGSSWGGTVLASGVTLAPGDTQTVGSIGEPGSWASDSWGWIYVNLLAGEPALALQIYAYVSAGSNRFLQGWIGPKAANSSANTPMPAGAWTAAVVTATADGHTLTYTLNLDAPYPPYRGRLVAFVRGTSWALQDTVPSVPVVGTPAVGLRGGAILACARGLNGSLYTFWKDSSAVAWVALPLAGPNVTMPQVAGDPAMHVASDGSVSVFARGTQNQLYCFSLPAAATPAQWQVDNISADLGGTAIDGNPAITDDATNGVIVYARSSPEGHLLRFTGVTVAGKAQVADVSSNANPGGPPLIAADPTALVASDGSVDVYAAAPGNQLSFFYLPPQPTQWEMDNLSYEVGGTPIAGNPAVASDGGNVYARGTAGQLLDFAPSTTPNWHWTLADVSPASGDVQLTGDPVVLLQGGSTTVFARGTDSHGTDSQLIAFTLAPGAQHAVADNLSWDVGGTAISDDPAILANGGTVSVFAIAPA